MELGNEFRVMLAHYTLLRNHFSLVIWIYQAKVKASFSLFFHYSTLALKPEAFQKRKNLTTMGGRKL
jgi:hypothetical protein